MSNYRVILQHSIPAEPITGRIAVPGIWVKFENGIADVRDEKTVELMLNHRMFKVDFLPMEESKDPYEDNRKLTEPDHSTTEIKYGHVESTTSPKTKVTINSETKKILREMATEMAAEMAPAMAKQMLKEVLSQKASEETTEAPAEETPTEEVPEPTEILEEANAPEETTVPEPIETPDEEPEAGDEVTPEEVITTEETEVTPSKPAARKTTRKTTK